VLTIYRIVLYGFIILYVEYFISVDMGPLIIKL